MTFKHFLIEQDFLKKYKIKQESSGLGFSEESQKWYGWSHRALCGFGIGDMLFDEDYSPDGVNIEKMKFTDRGSVKIETLDQAKQAAKNFSSYVS